MMAVDRLDAGRGAYKLAVEVYRVTEKFPKREWYGLGSQTRRAAFSVPLNLAEGSAKRGVAEFRRYVDIAIGSLDELRIALRVSKDLGMLSAHDWVRIETLAETTSKTVWRLAKALDRRKRGS